MSNDKSEAQKIAEGSLADPLSMETWRNRRILRFTRARDNAAVRAKICARVNNREMMIAALAARETADAHLAALVPGYVIPWLSPPT